MSQYWATNNLFSEAIKEVRNHYGSLPPAIEAPLIAAYMNAASQSEIADRLDRLAEVTSRIPESMANNMRRSFSGP